MANEARLVTLVSGVDAEVDVELEDPTRGDAHHAEDGHTEPHHHRRDRNTHQALAVKPSAALRHVLRQSTAGTACSPGRGTLSGQGLSPLFPCRCGLCQSRCLKSSSKAKGSNTPTASTPPRQPPLCSGLDTRWRNFREPSARAAVMPKIPEQCGSASASRAGIIDAGARQPPRAQVDLANC